MTATTEIRDLGRAWANDPRTVALTRPAREKLFAWAEGWVQLDWEGGEYTRRDVVLALALELGVPEDAAWALCKQSMGWSDE